LEADKSSVNRDDAFQHENYLDVRIWSEHKNFLQTKNKVLKLKQLSECQGKTKHCLMPKFTSYQDLRLHFTIWE
jgi:hypothetical protein